MNIHDFFLEVKKGGFKDFFEMRFFLKKERIYAFFDNCVIFCSNFHFYRFFV